MNVKERRVENWLIQSEANLVLAATVKVDDL